MKKILIIRFSSIGDIVLCSPVLRNLSSAFPGVQIDVLTKPAFISLWEKNPFVHRTLVWGNGSDKAHWKSTSYDIIIDLHNNTRSAWVKCLRWDCPNVTVDKQNWKKLWYVWTKSKRFAADSLMSRYQSLLHRLSIATDNMSLDFFGETDRGLDKSIKTPYIALVLGGSFKTKQVPLHKWKEFLELYDAPYPLVLLGSQKELELAEVLEKEFPNTAINLCGKLNLMESAANIKSALVVVSGDTGLGHIAAAWGKPLLWIWGNTTPELGMLPPLKSFDHLLIQMEVEGLNCRPCSKLGHDKCPKKHFQCMNHSAHIWKQNLEKLIGSGLG
jgi:ADP-heptose:LPS heptosyltransferase